MKKNLAIICALIMLLAMCSGCNKQIFDVTCSFDSAIIQLPNGTVVEGEVTSWIDYDDGDQIQVVIDGTTYLAHSSDIVLIKQ